MSSECASSEAARASFWPATSSCTPKKGPVVRRLSAEADVYQRPHAARIRVQGRRGERASTTQRRNAEQRVDGGHPDRSFGQPPRAGPHVVSALGEKVVEVAHVSALLALAASVVGGLTTTGTSQLTQQAQVRAGRLPATATADALPGTSLEPVLPGRRRFTSDNLDSRIC